MSAAAAFFDLDRTVIPGSSLLLVVLPLARRGRIRPGKAARAILAQLTFRLRGQTARSAEIARSEFLRFGAGWSVADAHDTFAELVVPAVVRRVRPLIATRFEQHRRRDEPVYLVSSAPQQLVDLVAERLGLAGAAGTVAEAHNEVFTGGLARPFCHGEEKAHRLRELAETHGLALERSWAYADSLSDLPMLKAVGNPVVVAPDRSLAGVAAREGWKVLRP